MNEEERAEADKQMKDFVLTELRLINILITEGVPDPIMDDMDAGKSALGQQVRRHINERIEKYS